MFSSIKPGDSMTAPLRVVLHKASHNGEWVTHIQNMQLVSFYSGNYHGGDYPSALSDYRKRCAKYNVASFVCDHCGSTDHTNENCMWNASTRITP